ncbi:MAG: hypothetical protein AAF721_33185 [Myxococcota bacterium]
MKRSHYVGAAAFVLSGLVAPTASADTCQYIATTTHAQVHRRHCANPVLSQFLFSFTNGDHKIRDIRATRDAGNLTSWFADKSPKDPFRAEVYYDSPPRYVARSASARCKGSCSILTTGRPSGRGWELAIVGFSVHRTDGNDNNVKKLSIVPGVDDSRYHVEYRDNGSFTYDVRLQYAWVKGAHATGNRRLRGSRRANSGTSAIPLGSLHQRYTGIRGFSVEFGNGDHHLKEIGFIGSYRSGYRALLQDNDSDDPASAMLDLVWWN